jgi:D-alanyl-D-alanine carboxypeptidase (penicillin-binding protein 5/6)
VAVVVTLAALLAGMSYGSAAATAPLPAAEPEVVEVAPVIGPPQPLDEPDARGWAIAALGVEEPLAAGNASEPLPIASVAKVVTALVVLEEYPVAPGEPGPDVPFTTADQAIYQQVVAQGGSSAPVPVGGTLTLRQSLEAMLLPSGNNYAISLAVWAFGSVDAYVQRANEWTAAQGMPTMTIADPSGFSRANSGTATDLLRLGELALADPLVAEVVAMPEAAIPGVGTVANTNKLLGVDGVDGIKTGTFTGSANLLFSADAAVGATSVTLVGVVLGVVDQAVVREEVTALLETVTPGLRVVDALQAGEELAGYESAWDDTAAADAAEAVSLVVWSDTPVEVEVRAEPVVEASDREQVGTAVVTAGAQQVEVPLVLDGEIGEPGLWWRLTNPEELAWESSALASVPGRPGRR